MPQAGHWVGMFLGQASATEGFINPACDIAFQGNLDRGMRPCSRVAERGQIRASSPEIVAKLNKEINEGLKGAVLNERFRELAVEPIVFTPSELGAFTVAEEKRWRQAVEASGAE